MGRLINGPNGPFIGKAGAFVGYVVNGVGFIKGHYKKRTKAPTEKEILNQKKFAAAQAWLKPVTVPVRAGFKGYKPNCQGFVAAKSWLMKNAMSVVDGEIVIDPSLVKLSSGSLPLPENLTCEVKERIIRFTWQPSFPSGIGFDQIMTIAYELETPVSYGSPYGNCRHSGEAFLKISDLAPVRTYHVYAAFIAADRSRQSDSVYLGAFEF